ncbi:CheW protein [Rhodomicrobium vannielii ATCC 17100]|uniref:CheW protein n=1 Tax=Rhodomicrobium vannielii (strain ATCC 17100 / DSM 162 / LMG 4299 / NCIMB 10020 / ATH 3.1.1) TaxID=648757 RepID=E3I694_RHOVT|nr:chemotaxis protein CheW [Rhodomicrobium vannielii]ADP71759.1 CheW protein [Rhodomicrobium vannielii ATCC 17100]
MTEAASAIPKKKSVDGSSSDGASQQFISFSIGGEEYAIDITAVREIRGWSGTTSLPNQPDYVLGVMNLRGTIIPVYDLKLRFGTGATEAAKSKIVIIVAIRDRTVGLLVDAVSDILTIETSEIRPVPEMDRGVVAEFLSGIVSVDGTMVVVLSLEHLFQRDYADATLEIEEASVQ